MKRARARVHPAALLLAALPCLHGSALAATEPAPIRKAIADRLTPAELEELQARAAENLARRALVPRTAADLCSSATYEVSTLPFGPVSDTTVGQADNYDLPTDVVAPTCTAATSCTGGASAASLPRGSIYAGTGTGPDRAYRIRTDENCDLVITADPTSDTDLALIVYETKCSSLLSDCVCVDDNSVKGVAETVTLSAVAGVDYFIVIDGYSTAGAPPGPSGPFDLTVTTTGNCRLVEAPKGREPPPPDPEIPTLGGWGLVALAILLASLGVILVLTRGKA